MELEQLQERKQQLITARDNTSQSYHMLCGHLAEVDYQIGVLLSVQPHEQAMADDCNTVAPEVE